MQLYLPLLLRYPISRESQREMRTVIDERESKALASADVK